MRVSLGLVLLLTAGRAHAQDDACRAGRLEAERLQASGAYLDAANEYVRIARERPPCSSLDEVLYNAALNYQAARLMDTALRIREIFIEQFPQSPLLPRVLFARAGNYHSLMLYREAADAYTELARRFPAELGESCTEAERTDHRCLSAPDALETAIFFRLGLGQRDELAAAVALFERFYARSLPERTAAVVFAQGSGLGDPAAIVAHSEAFLRRYASVATLDQRARALVALGRARLVENRPEEAAEAFSRVVADVTPEALTGGRVELAVQQMRLRRARDDAHFELADLRAAAPALELEPPPPARGRSLADVRAWAEGPLAAWRDRQLAIAAPLVAEYERVLDGAFLPDSRIRALERIGAIYTRVVRAGEGVAAPAAVQRDEALRTAFERARSEALREVRTLAIARYEHATRLAREWRLFSESSERCADALVALAPDRHAAPYELHGEPSRSGPVGADPPPVLVAARAD